MTSQLQTVEISNTIESSSEEESSNVTGGTSRRSRSSKRSRPKKLKRVDSLIPDKDAKAEVMKKKRRKSFDLTLLKAF